MYVRVQCRYRESEKWQDTESQTYVFVVVESERVDGMPRQRNFCYLGCLTVKNWPACRVMRTLGFSSRVMDRLDNHFSDPADRRRLLESLVAKVVELDLPNDDGEADELLADLRRALRESRSVQKLASGPRARKKRLRELEERLRR